MSYRCSIHVIDTDPTSLSAGGWLEDVSKVEKYEISDEAYNLRENTYRRFKEKKLQVLQAHPGPSAHVHNDHTFTTCTLGVAINDNRRAMW